MPGDDVLLGQWLSGEKVPAVALAPGDHSHAASDAFGRLRVSDAVTLFDSQMEYDAQPLIWAQFTSGSLASIQHLSSESAVEMSGGLDSMAVRQSRQYVRYQPGKSQMALMTFRGGKTTQEVTRRVGYFDADDGIFFEIDGETPYFVLRSSVSGLVQETRVAQASWNVDRLDNSDDAKFNPSGHGLDLTRTQILIIDLEWLGVGTVRVGFVIDGVIRFAHYFHNANVAVRPYMATANLPVRYEIGGGGGVTGTHGLMQICASVISEGGFQYEQGFPFAATNGPTGTPVTNRRPILSVRPGATFKGAVNRARILPESVDIYSDDQAVYWELVQGGVLVSGSFSPVHADSVAEADIAATAVLGGITIAGGFVAATSVGGGGATKVPGQAERDFLSRVPLTLEIDGSHPTGTPSDVLSVVVGSRAGATDVSAALNWRELR
jgi:hypothetical protein